MTLSFGISLTNQLPKGGFIQISLETDYFSSIDDNYQCAYIDANNL